MTFAEALIKMTEGKKVRHRFFTSEEFMFLPTKSKDIFMFEDGVQCHALEFWAYRKGEAWLTDWEVYNG